MEIGQKYYIFDQVKEQGNKHYNRNKYIEALLVYEQAVSLMKWLQYRSNQSEPDMKYGLDMMIYNDNNTELVDNYNLNHKSDQQMVDSMLFMIYLSMSVCYMKLNHYELAKTVIQDSMNHNSKSSMSLFRMSQAISYDKSSSSEQLDQAEQFIKQAIQTKKGEKIFDSPTKIQEILGTTNSDVHYQNHLEYVQNRKEQKQQEQQEILEILFKQADLVDHFDQKRVKQNIISEEDLSKMQQEQNQSKYQDDHISEFDIIKEIENKYY